MRSVRFIVVDHEVAVNSHQSTADTYGQRDPDGDTGQREWRGVPMSVPFDDRRRDTALIERGGGTWSGRVLQVRPAVMAEILCRPGGGSEAQPS